jgi:hypothetical protein
VECEDLATVGVHIGVGAAQRAIARHLAGQAVDAAVVVGAAAAGVPIVAVARMVDAARHVGQRAEVIVEGMIFLHHDDDVL